MAVSPGTDGGPAEYEILIIEACGALAESSDCVFRIGGFGDDSWRLDLEYDLSAFMEQFVDLMRALRDRHLVEVDLYSQGIERSLIFHPQDDEVRVECRSRTDWIPNPTNEYIYRVDIISMLERLAVNFSRALQIYVPQLARLPLFVNWRSGAV